MTVACVPRLLFAACACALHCHPRHLLDGEWSYDEWRTSHLDAWVAKCKSLLLLLCLPCCCLLSCAWSCVLVVVCICVLVVVCVCVCVHRDQLLLDQPDWDFDAFMSAHLADYLIMSQEFMDEYWAEQQQQQ